ncbi:hypothetical protein GTY54_34625 [Streptomyces sp. SID625]|nr:hypothetical protein [Streptomyces sp. SID625]
MIAPGGISDGAVLNGTNNAPEERRAAALCVARYAKDVDDARELLAALGLIAPASREVRS